MLCATGHSYPNWLNNLDPMTARETPAGFIFDAREFLKAAELVLNRASGISLPAYFLFGRSIELSLKAFLLAHSMSAKELAIRPYGHNLVALLEAAAQHGLHVRVPFATIDSGVLELLSHEYLSSRLGYRITGRTYHLPLIEMTEDIARRLVGGVGEHLASAGAD